ncbi:multicopper oxidase family protein [Geobacter pickeringii]|uniref:Multicopper oxidase n=1 Tax=Geobacter pickeringii TaxID=345632 RepID=A0A0B5B7W1_9BACT|nr:multicopper oxidase [Geobacter pickeringii]AJE02653.1 multicopper oxidase [Geobacter pickeringii]
MISRRKFLQLSALAGGATLLPLPVRWLGPRNAHAFYQSVALKKFVQPLRGVGPGGIPVAAPDLFSAPVTGALHYTIDIGQFTDQLHPALAPTTLWGYNPARGLGGNVTPTHLGGIIVAQKGQPLQITFRNNLPNRHIIPLDSSIMGADPARQNRTTVHLHGGLVPWISDGGPFTWWDPSGNRGLSFLNNQVLNPSAALNEAEYYYPNNQSARMLWYHDHAFGITRINAYAGIASAYLIRDDFEGSLRNRGLPDFIENGGREIPIVIQDKIFVDGATIGAMDPTWPGLRTTGTLWYPHVYERNRWKLQGNAKGGNLIPPDPSVIPEMFGDTMLANGTVYPEAPVEPRRYRLRILNACNARFLNLQLYVDDGSLDGITLNAAGTPANAKGPDFLVIGTEGGFLPKPVLVPSNVPFNPATLGGSLVTAPAERFDIIVDFTGFEGKKMILYNDAPAPFPMGDPRNDYFPGAPKNPTITNPGFGPNTRQIMRFAVATTATVPADPPLAITVATDLTPGIDPFLVPQVPGLPLPPPPGVTVRQLTLNETFDASGRLIQMLGTNVPLVKGTFGRGYMDPATESPRAGTVEVWQIANLTGDTHPIHFHLVNVQILSRQPFQVPSYNGTPSYTAPPRGPDATEVGWKDTVRMNPGEVTTVIMKFDLPAVPFTVPASPRTGGHEYVWHCHILEHEEHDMMRPLIVT